MKLTLHWAILWSRGINIVFTQTLTLIPLLLSTFRVINNTLLYLHSSQLTNFTIAYFTWVETVLNIPSKTVSTKNYFQLSKRTIWLKNLGTKQEMFSNVVNSSDKLCSHFRWYRVHELKKMFGFCFYNQIHRAVPYLISLGKLSEMMD